jgi:hypothetical protein
MIRASWGALICAILSAVPGVEAQDAEALGSGVVRVVVFPDGGLDIEAVRVGERRFTLTADGRVMSGIVVDRRGVVAIPLVTHSSEARFAVEIGGEWRAARQATFDAASFTSLLIVDTTTPFVEAEAEVEASATGPAPSEVVLVDADGGAHRVSPRVGGDGRPRFGIDAPEHAGALVRRVDGAVLGWTTHGPREAALRLASVSEARALVSRSTAQLAQAQRALEREWVPFYARVRSLLGARAIDASPVAADVVALARDAGASNDPFVLALAAGYLWNVAWLTREGRGVRDAPAEAVVEQCRTTSVRFARRVADQSWSLHSRSRALLAISGRHAPPPPSGGFTPIESSPEDDDSDASGWFPVLWAGFAASPGNVTAYGFSLGGLAPVWRTEGFVRVALGVGLGVDWLRASASGVTVSELGLSLPLGASLRVGGDLAFLGTFVWAPTMAVTKACPDECKTTIDARIGTLRVAAGLAWKRFTLGVFSTFLLPEGGGSGDVRLGGQVGTSF